MTQCPFSAATSNAFSATTSCPCPRDTLWSFPLSMVNPSFFPKVGKNRKSTRVIQNRGSGTAFHNREHYTPPILFTVGWKHTSHPGTCFGHLERCGPGTFGKLVLLCSCLAGTTISTPESELPLCSPGLVTAACSPPVCLLQAFRGNGTIRTETLTTVFLYELYGFHFHLGRSMGSVDGVTAHNKP